MLLQNNRQSLRRSIDEKCKECIYDQETAGTWRQQVSLCSVTGCALYRVRPRSQSPIPESVLDYYHVSGEERALYARPRPREGRFSGRSLRPSSLSPADTLAAGKGQSNAVSKSLSESCD